MVQVAAQPHTPRKQSWCWPAFLDITLADMAHLSKMGHGPTMAPDNPLLAHTQNEPQPAQLLAVGQCIEYHTAIKYTYLNTSHAAILARTG